MKARRAGGNAFAALFLLFFFLLARPLGAADSLETSLEKLLGKQVAWALTQNSGADIDPLLANWVRRVGGEVSGRAPRRDVKYTFGILGTDVANAVAAPGGYIFVTRGLLDYIESDDELASILAHESGHVSKRHAAQQVGGQLVFLALLSTIRGKNADQIRTTAQVYNVLRTLAKSREMEAQADEEALRYASSAGYDPNGLVRFFTRLQTGSKDPSWLERYFDTHPSPRRRVESALLSPLVTFSDRAARERTAAGYERRGLRALAQVVREGKGDPLAVPSPAPVSLPPFVADDRKATLGRLEETRKGLAGTLQAQRTSGALQQVLLVNSRPGDYRWLYVAARAYALQTDIDDLYARTARVLRTAAPTFDGLARYASRPAGDPVGVDAAIGRAEVRRAAERLGGAPTPLARAAKATLAVLADLNNPLYHPRGSAAWVRYGTLEGLLRYAESELGRADKASGQAWRLLSLARIRRYQARLGELAPEGDANRRALWSDLAARRLGSSGVMDARGPAGEVTALVALAVETNKSAAAVAAGRGDTPWADWILEKNGIPENIATAMRLLTLDLERETAAQDKR